MPRTCTICGHPKRTNIELALLNGEPYRDIAARSGTSPAALLRHKQDHIPKALAKAHEVKEIARADSLLNQVRNLQARAMGILEKAEASGDLRTALAAIGQAKGVLELQAKVTGEIGGPAEESQPDPLHVNLANIIALPRRRKRRLRD